MPWVMFIWDDERNGNVEHIAEHDLTPEDVEHVVMNPIDNIRSRRTKRLAVKGFTPDGRFIFVTYEMVDDMTVEVITAYEI